MLIENLEHNVLKAEAYRNLVVNLDLSNYDVEAFANEAIGKALCLLEIAQAMPEILPSIEWYFENIYDEPIVEQVQEEVKELVSLGGDDSYYDAKDLAIVLSDILKSEGRSADFIKCANQLVLDDFYGDFTKLSLTVEALLKD